MAGQLSGRRNVERGYKFDHGRHLVRRQVGPAVGENFFADFVAAAGIINIGGLKVHPEEIEAVINRHAEVRMSRARSRRSPITGAIVVADVILADGADKGRRDEIRDMILADCRASLAPHKVPAMIKFVTALDVTTAGKLARHDA